jgi:DNA-binding transcriptional MerR regulator
MNERLSLEELAEQVNEWCDQHRIVPANGQSGESLTERNLRYYRSLGLIDAPMAGGGQGYGEKHRLQVIAIRLLQAQGLPLNRIRELLFGRELPELRQIEKRGLAELDSHRVASFQPAIGESWTVYPLDGDFLLISRRGRPVSAEKREQLLGVINQNDAIRSR